MAISVLRGFQREVVAAVVQVVRPVRGWHGTYCAARRIQRGADRLAAGEVAIECRREGGSRMVGHRPPGADEVGDAATQESLGEADAAVKLPQRIDRRAQAAGFAGVE